MFDLSIINEGPLIFSTGLLFSLLLYLYQLFIFNSCQSPLIRRIKSIILNHRSDSYSSIIKLIYQYKRTIGGVFLIKVNKDGCSGFKRDFSDIV